ncbi:TetR/AcrR family transcriptional regulator [Cryptosporangium phraense]|uniref:TetR/AcrR family transcriptional regulator n=1 Tax=Cryptosporangium phraense TaxID=2593070 RepID=A0A545AUY3_9ACTN|nr:TetR/AcrR family transcriptional regulator [Cryptosporangium phraense]TQS45091.1 TetR/AcrR family transcriptional regulator [Cryptosporangium phraense]
MPRAGLGPATVIAAGADLADEVGLANLTMGLVADRLGVKAPSLYKHIQSLDALHRGISIEARREIGYVLARATAGKSGPDAIHAFADAWRGWARDHPGRYATTVRAASNDDDEDRQVTNDGLRLLYDVFAGFDLPGARVVDAARALRATLHGYVTLEAGGGFGLARDVDRSFSYLIDTLIIGLRSAGNEPDQREAEPEYHGPEPR